MSTAVIIPTGLRTVIDLVQLLLERILGALGYVIWFPDLLFLGFGFPFKTFLLTIEPLRTLASSVVESVVTVSRPLVPTLFARFFRSGC